MVAKLQMPLKQKIGVGALFALGFFVVVASSKTKYYLGSCSDTNEAASYSSLLLEQERDHADMHCLHG